MKIVVIEALGLHLGYLGCYGNDWVATPNLDRLAAEGVVFDWHIADHPELQAITPWTERSVGTGCYALPGSVPIREGEAPAEPAKQARQEPRPPKTGQGPLPGQAPSRSTSVVKPRVVRCEKLAKFVDRAMKAIASKDAWVWIEGPSLLPPWDLEAEVLDVYFDEVDIEAGLTPWSEPPFDLVELKDAQIAQLQNTYAAVVTFFDAQLGDIIEHVSQSADTLLCVTARSGVPLGEHGMIGVPEPRLHDELVHVPLLMRLPSGAEAGMRIAALTQPLDLLPTFLDALGQTIPAMDGKSLGPLLRGVTESVHPFAVSMLRVGARESWLMRTLDRALHVPFAPATEAAPQLFVKPEDRWEVNDLYQQHFESADALEKTLREFAEALNVGRPH